MTSIPLNSSELQNFQSVDWNDLNSVSRHWKLFMKHLEIQVLDDAE
jgi:hypothetical protein